MRSRLEAAVVLAAALSLSVASAGDPDPKAKAAAALALAQAQRTREHVVADAAAGCYDDADYKVAQRFAAREDKPLVLWIGMRCTERPAVRKALGDAVHCHLKERYGDPTPRVAVVGRDGNDYFVRREKVTDETAGKLRAKWEAVPATKPADARPIEVSRRVSPCAKCAEKDEGCTCIGGCPCEATARAVPPIIYPTAPPAYPVIRYTPTPWTQPMPAPGFSAGFNYRGPFGGSFAAGACVGGT